MHKMRRMEIICDTSYKDREIRGFCHLYDGQEATATGINAAFTKEDCWITSYRCHCIALIRGSSVYNILSELYGMKDGSTKGKGGSMHFYNKSHNFYGGQGIVGAASQTASVLSGGLAPGAILSNVAGQVVSADAIPGSLAYNLITSLTSS